MNVYQHVPDVASHAIDRVIAALAQYAPARVAFTPDVREADVVVMHVIGRREHMVDAARRYTRRGQRYVVMQYVLRSSLNPSTEDWLALWTRAELVWSYYDLHALCAEDDTDFPAVFYHAPLGVAPVFAPTTDTKTHLVMTSGRSWLTESIRECVLAAGGRPSIHLGADLGHPSVTCLQHLNDTQLAAAYSRCQWVAGLRRTEGFELPAAEGLLCGARPIMFDEPHYRHWFGDWADYIPETPREETLQSLTEVFRHDPRPVTPEERASAAALFHWPTLVQQFWEQIQ